MVIPALISNYPVLYGIICSCKKYIYINNNNKIGIFNLLIKIENLRVKFGLLVVCFLYIVCSIVCKLSVIY